MTQLFSRPFWQAVRLAWRNPEMVLMQDLYHRSTVAKHTEDIGINALCGEILKNNVTKGWVTPGAPVPVEIQVANIHSEVSELWEEYRNNKPMLYHKEGKPEGMMIECADVIIRCLHFFSEQGVAPTDVILLKHNYNKTRPYRHGGKRA